MRRHYVATHISSMFRHFSLGLVASMAAICPTSVAAEEVQKIQNSPQPPPSEEWSFPETSVFLGIGLGTSIVSYDTQYLYNLGLSRIYKNGELVAIGGADGPAIPDPTFPASKSLAPAGQIGFYSRYKESNWIFGAKATYSFLNSYSNRKVLAIPQYGTSTDPSTNSFDGTSYNTYSIDAKNQFTIMPFIGRKYSKGYFYAGAGLGLTDVEVNVDDVVGYALLNGIETDISGEAQNFSDSKLGFGVALSAGVTYFLNNSLFLDFNYTYSKPNVAEFNIASPYRNPAEGSSELGFEGTLIGSATRDISTNTILLTLNWAF